MTAETIVHALLEEIEDQHRFVTVVVLRNADDPEVLLVRRENPPEAGKWGAPGGHANEGEALTDAAKRELKEETGLEAPSLHYFDRVFIPERDAFDNFYWTTVDDDAKAHANDDAEKTKWTKVSEIGELAFNCQVQIKDAAERAFAIGKIAESKAEGKYGRNGLLIVFEGIDGAGKTTQVRKLTGWLAERGYKVKTTKWNSSEILNGALYKAKRHKELSPILFSLLHAADLTWRYENIVLPALKKGKVVLCDRYYYTSYVRDSLRGVNDAILDYIYEDWRKPDVVFYCKVPIRTAVERLLREKGVYYYSAGRDIGYKGSKEECAMQYEQDMEKVYKRVLAKEPSVVEIDTERTIKEIAEEIKKVLKHKFKV